MNVKVLNAALLTVMLLAPTYVRAEAAEEEKPWIRKHVMVRAGAVIDGDYFAAAETVEIAGTINGDVYVAGPRIVVMGRVKGDLLAVGGNVTVSGTVDQDVRVAGGHVIIGGRVGRNLTVAAGNVEIAQSAEVLGGVVAAGGTVDIDGRIEKDVRVGAATFTLSGKSGGKLLAAGRSLRLTSTAGIAGDVKYWSDAPLSIDDGVIVGGAVIPKAVPESLRESIAEAGRWGARVPVILTFVSFVSTLILGMLLIFLYPAVAKNVVGIVKTQTAASFVIGIAALIMIPVVAALLLASIAASPIGVMLMALYLMSLYVARIYTILLAGELIFSWLHRPIPQIWALGLGAVVYFLLTLIPMFGYVVTFGAVVFGLGALLLVQRQYLFS
jgi:cytoskeletal protein CcmA (bactofilin family)